MNAPNIMTCTSEQWTDHLDRGYAETIAGVRAAICRGYGVRLDADRIADHLYAQRVRDRVRVARPWREEVADLLGAA